MYKVAERCLNSFIKIFDCRMYPNYLTDVKLLQEIMTQQTSVHWFFKWYLDSQSVIFKLPQKFKKEKKQAIGNRDILEEYIIFFRKPLNLQFHKFFEYFTSQIRGIMWYFFSYKNFLYKNHFWRAEIQAIVVHHSYFYVQWKK